MKWKLLIVLTFFLHITEIQLFAQNKKDSIPNEKKAQQVIDDYIDYVGGKKNIEKINTLSIKLFRKVNEISYRIEKYYDVPNKFSKLLFADNVLMEKYIVNGTEISHQALSDLDVNQDTVFNFLNFEKSPFPEYFLFPKNFKLRYDSIKKIDSLEVFQICASHLKSDLKYYLFFDKNTGRKVSEMEIDNSENDSIKQITYITEWKDTMNVRLPSAYIYKTGNQKISFFVSNLRINEKIDSKVFNPKLKMIQPIQKPIKKKPAKKKEDDDENEE